MPAFTKLRSFCAIDSTGREFIVYAPDEAGVRDLLKRPCTIGTPPWRISEETEAQMNAKVRYTEGSKSFVQK